MLLCSLGLLSCMEQAMRCLHMGVWFMSPALERPRPLFGHHAADALNESHTCCCS